MQHFAAGLGLSSGSVLSDDESGAREECAVKAGELEIRLKRTSCIARLCTSGTHYLEPAQLTPDREASEVDAIRELTAHADAVRISCDADDALNLAARIQAAQAARPDALLVLVPPKLRSRVPLQLPITVVDSDDGRGLFDDFTQEAEKRGVIRVADTPMHVLHARFSDPVWPRPLAFEAPWLIVIEGISGDHGQIGWIADAASYAPAVISIFDAPENLPGHVHHLYRKLTHDMNLDEIARELMRRGALVATAFAPGAEAGLLRRAAVEHAPSGINLVDVFTSAKRPARSELETVFAKTAARVRDQQLAPIQRHLDSLTFDEELHAADAVVQASEAISNVLGGVPAPVMKWLRPQRAELEPTLNAGIEFDVDGLVEEAAQDVVSMPPRHVEAVVHCDGQPLQHGTVAGKPVQLDVAIHFAGAGVPAIPTEVLAEAFGEHSEIDVDFFVWTRDMAVECPNPRARLPRTGESSTVEFTLRPRASAQLTPGASETRRARVAAYHGNRLLQSMTIDLSISQDAETAAAAPAPVMDLDFISSDELLAVDQGDAPTVSIFVNDNGGSHWIGARAGDGTAATGAPIALGQQDTSTLAQIVHTTLSTASNFNGRDRYADPLAGLDPALKDQRAAQLVALARAGRDMFETLFADSDGFVERDGVQVPLMDEVRSALAAPDGTIEIGRCRPEAAALPWQLVYDLPLAAAPTGSVCKHYLEQLGQPADLLDNPKQCASRDACPHRVRLGGGPRTADADQVAHETICPFGFWGTRHRITQPLGLRGATGPNAMPSGDLGVTVGLFNFDGASDHIANLLPKEEGSKPRAQTNADLLGYLRSRRDAIVYFYCHGLTVENAFVLKIGKNEDVPAQYVRSGDFLEMSSWSHGPIVVLNGCQTMQVDPTRLHNLLGTLRNRGASAIIGPEIAMFTTSASAIGEHIVKGIFDGKPLEQILLDMRRELLREMSPMGLAYNVYGAAGLTWSPKQHG